MALLQRLSHFYVLWGLLIHLIHAEPQPLRNKKMNSDQVLVEETRVKLQCRVHVHQCQKAILPGHFTRHGSVHIFKVSQSRGLDLGSDSIYVCPILIHSEWKE